jgi:hypothetical protein
MNNTNTKGDLMSEKEHENDMQRVETTSAPYGMAGQPQKKRYRIWFWRESVTFREDEAENEEQLLRWLYGDLWKYDQMDGHDVMRIDNVGLVRDDLPIENRPSRAEYFATVRELYTAWRNRLHKPETDENKSPSPDETSGQSELKRYRVWYWFSETHYVYCEAENVMRAGEFFVKWCGEDENGVSTYELQYIEELRPAPDLVTQDEQYMGILRKLQAEGVPEDKWSAALPTLIQPTQENRKFGPEDLGWHTTQFGVGAGERAGLQDVEGVAGRMAEITAEAKEFVPIWTEPRPTMPSSTEPRLTEKEFFAAIQEQKARLKQQV